MQPHRITLCAYDWPPACGGPFKWAGDLAAFLHAGGRSVEVLILCPGGRRNSGIARTCDQAGIPSSVLDIDEAVYLEDQTEWILRQWAQRPSDVFIANLVLPALYAGSWIRRGRGRTVGVIHSNPDHDPFYADVLRHFVSGPPEWRLDAVVAVTEHGTAKARECAPSEVRIATIPCGTQLVDSQAVPPSTGLRLLYCGRLVQEAKRIRDVTLAFLEAAKLGGVTATICGEGEERAWVEARLAGQTRVQYVGHLQPDDALALMAQHHVIVLLSDYEGLSLALVEGMACGLVPVCFDEPSGAREVIQHGVNGYLVKDRGPSFTEAIEQLRDPEVWARLSAEARKTAERRYAHPVVFEKWAALIRDLAEGAQPRPVRLPRRVNLAAARAVARCVPG